MQITQLRQAIGSQHFPTQTTPKPQAEKPKPSEALQNNFKKPIDVNDVNLQRGTVTYLNKLMKFHGTGLQAELTKSYGKVYVSFQDVDSGEVIKRLSIEKVINILAGGHTMLDVSV